ncbi:cytochrome c oxidase subunit 3 [Candidatus Poriferisodalis sp.]|uniref:cytochrome c oxidase subunit 3 n=1 Tax=Candidatus Poriferisodalis sp. TaxID=3101277 RepID=UPI003B017B7B
MSETLTSEVADTPNAAARAAAPGQYSVPGPAPRPRSQLVGTGFAVAAGAMAVAGALGHYMARRHASGADPGHDWLAGQSVPNPQLAYALITLLLSVVTAHWAVWASSRDERGHTWAGLALTLVLGLAFFNMVMFSLNRMELEIGSGEWATLAFAVTGLSLAILIVGMFYLGLMTLRALGGSVGRDRSTPLGAAVFFWDFGVLAWAATWYVVYVVK